MNPILLIIVFLITSFVGYLVIKNVPSLLHTPLMSGMNALAGICLLGAVVAMGVSYHQGGVSLIVGQVFGGIGVLLATINVVAGFGVTHRMLRMFNPKKKDKK